VTNGYYNFDDRYNCKEFLWLMAIIILMIDIIVKNFCVKRAY